MARVTRLVTVADVGATAGARRVSVTVRHEAVLDDGRRLLLLDGRGWSAEARGPAASEVADLWALTSREEVAETARVVVGPDEPFGGRTQEDMAAAHWNELPGRLRALGVHADPGELRQLPHDVVLADRLLARLGPGSGDAA